MSKTETRYKTLGELALEGCEMVWIGSTDTCGFSFIEHPNGLKISTTDYVNERGEVRVKGKSDQWVSTFTVKDNE